MDSIWGQSIHPTVCLACELPTHEIGSSPWQAPERKGASALLVQVGELRFPWLWPGQVWGDDRIPEDRFGSDHHDYYHYIIYLYITDTYAHIYIIHKNIYIILYTHLSVYIYIYTYIHTYIYIYTPIYYLHQNIYTYINIDFNIHILYKHKYIF